MLDVGRHFQPLADLFRLVDLLALHKYNVLHLHLTEDQGWRFESLRHPRLQEVGSWRRETRKHHDEHGDGTPHGGYYRQDQLRALVAYAAQRGITVVPELEFPGHVRAVLAAYPELGLHPDAGVATATGFGVFTEVLSLSDAAMDFVLDVYAELLDVFPSRFIHVGGDECPPDEWLQSPAAQQLAEQRGLADASQLQRWFTEQLRDWLAAHGRQLVGWDEICDQGALPGAVAMAWRGADIGSRAAAAGLDVVMSPMQHTYFDFYPGPGEEEQYAIGWLTTAETAYGFDPLAGIDGEHHARVLGTQCQVWTEYMPTMRRVEYMLFPRACAHSEVAWSEQAGRSWEEFEPRLAAHLERLDALGVNFRPLAGPHPWQQGGTGALRRPEAHRGRAASISTPAWTPPATH
jgi:hexosaminidase